LACLEHEITAQTAETIRSTRHVIDKTSIAAQTRDLVRLTGVFTQAAARAARLTSVDLEITLHGKRYG
jgi:hypothetical protein